MRLLIKFGYFGWQFTGFQKGNGTKSIEDTIIRVLEKAGISSSVQSAARTDRGVSAISNAFAVDTERKPSMVMGVLNGKIPEMMFHSYAVVPETFNPRHCDYKTYRYIILGGNVGPYLRQALKPFKGQHDFRNFCKMDGRNPVRTIKSISVSRKGERIFIDYKGRSFLWNQIRSITAYALEHSYAENQGDPFSREGKYPKLMDPNGLILTDITYKGFEFKDGMSLSKKKYMSSWFQQENLRHVVMDNFAFLAE